MFVFWKLMISKGGDSMSGEDQRKDKGIRGKHTEARLQSILNILQYKAETTQDLLDYALTEAIRLTESKIGYLYYYNEENKEFTLNSWSREVMEECSVVKQQTTYQLEKTGLWGEVVRQRKPVMLNDYEAPHPLKKGYPRGHVKLNKYLTVPIFNENCIIAVVGVANKEWDYDQSDLLQLTLLMDAVWKVVERRQGEVALRESEKKYRTLLDNLPVGAYRSTPGEKGEFLMANPAFIKMLGLESEEKLKMMRVNDMYFNPAERMLFSDKVIQEDGYAASEIRLKRKDNTLIWCSDTARLVRGERGEPLYFDCIIEDITERKQAEERLRYQLEFEKMVTDISATIANMPLERLNEAVDHALSVSGEFFGVERSYVAQFSPEGAAFSITYEWCAEGVEPQKSMFQGFSVDVLPWWARQMKALSHVYIPDVESLPGEAKRERAEFQRLGIQSLLTIPIVKDGGITGFLGFDSVSQKKTWTPEEISLLKVVGEIIAGVLEKRQSQEALKNSEQYNRSIIRSIPDIIIRYDRMGTYKDIIAPYQEKLYHLPREMKGKRVGEVLPGDVAAQIMEAIGEALTSDTLQVVEYSLQVPEGYLWFEGRVVPSGEHEVIALIRDITQEKRAEMEMLEANRRLDDIIEFLPDATFVINAQGIVVAWNKVMAEMTGIRREDILGKGDYAYALPFYGYRRPLIIDLVLKPDKEIEARYQYFKREAENSLIVEDYCPNLGESGIYVWSKATPLYDFQGHITGAVETIHDVSAMKLAEKSLLYQKNYFQALFKNSIDAVVIIDHEHRVMDINQVFSEVFEFTLEEIKGMGLDDVLEMGKPGSANRELTKKVIGGEKVIFESKRYSKSGKAMDMLIKAVPVIMDDEFIGGYAIYADITERKRYESQLKYLSLHDQLTGLYNRAFFDEELARLYNSREYPITIISVDVDGLKIVNDTLGHSKGDELLLACAGVLKESLRSSDFLARIGGDEFVAVLPKTDKRAAEMVRKRIHSALLEHNDQHPGPPLHLSLGVATTKGTKSSLIKLLKEADDLMYRDKRSRGGEARSKMMEAFTPPLEEPDK